MALPLPSVVADVGPGGPMVTSMRGINSLINDIYGNQIKGVEAQYAPVTTQANAASKLAYANLMGPQFLSKLMGNEDILANMTPEQRTKALQMVYQAGSGQGTGNALMNLPGMANQGQSQSPLAKIVGSVKNAFGFQSPDQSQPQQPVNAMAQQPNLSAQDRNAISNMQPGDAYTIQGNQATNQMAAPTMQQPAPQGANSFAENAGNYAGIKAEGKEAGTIRAKDINDLSDTVFQGQTKQATLDNISKIVSSPEFEQIRQTPILGHHELSYYERYGTPAQQNMVGQLRTLSGNVIRDASQDFKGAFRKGEQQLLENMKINPGDTVDAARGKMEQLSYLNQMITRRAQMTAQYMQQNHMSKLDAEQLADKQLNGDTIRFSIHNQLNPKPTDDDINFMAEKYNTTPEEIKKRLKAKGIF